jgi:hypothetical protein
VPVDNNMSAGSLIVPWLVAAASLLAVVDVAAQSLPCPRELVEAGRSSAGQMTYAPRENNHYCDGLVFAPHSGSLALVSLTLGEIVFPSDRQAALNISAPASSFSRIVVVGQRLQLGQTYRFDSVLEDTKTLSVSHAAAMFSFNAASADFGMVGTAASDPALLRIPIKVGVASDGGQNILMVVRTPVPLIRIVFDFLDAGNRQPITGAPRIIKDQIPAGQPITVTIPRDGIARRMVIKVVAQAAGGAPQGLLETILVPARP